MRTERTMLLELLTLQKWQHNVDFQALHIKRKALCNLSRAYNLPSV